MAENIVQVTEGVGKKLHTWDTTIGANLVQDEFVLPGAYPYPTFTAGIQSTSTATLNDHLITLNAGASLKVRVHRITIVQAGLATTAGNKGYSVLRTTVTTPTGGTAITPTPFDTADTAGATARSLPAVKGTEGAIILSPTQVASQAVLGTATQIIDRYEWKQAPNGKPIIIPAGATNGICLKNLTATAGATLTIEIEFTETSF